MKDYPDLYQPLRAVLDDPSRLIADPKKDIRSFRIGLTTPNGPTPPPTSPTTPAPPPTPPGCTPTITTDPTPASEAKSPPTAFTTTRGTTPRRSPDSAFADCIRVAAHDRNATDSTRQRRSR